MKAKSFYKNNKHNNMNPKEKENNQEEELKTQATPNECDEETVGQETSQENEAPLTEEEKLAQELEKANEQIEEQKDKYLRLSAEFDNYRKRTMKEKAELILNGGEKSISSILPIVDDFERALKNMETATDVAAVKEGVELIYNKFMSVLGQNGVKVIETKEQPLDTDYHEAIAVIPAPNEALKGKILDCVQTGYILNDKVIRHAKVVVGEQHTQLYGKKRLLRSTGSRKNSIGRRDKESLSQESHPISSGQESGRQNSRREIQGSGRSIRRTKQSGQACPLRSVRSCRTGWCRR